MKNLEKSYSDNDRLIDHLLDLKSRDLFLHLFPVSLFALPRGSSADHCENLHRLNPRNQNSVSFALGFHHNRLLNLGSDGFRA